MVFCCLLLGCTVNETIVLTSTMASTITTPGYPENYPDNADVTWKIESLDQTKIFRIEIRNFSVNCNPLTLLESRPAIILSQTEASYDFARIYEGSYDCNGNNVVLQEWHGSKQPEYHYFDYDQISVRFTSDGSYNVWGFELVVTLVDQGWYILAIHFQTRVYTVLKTKASQTVAVSSL